MKKSKVLLLGSQHGNEVLGINLYNYISSNYPELVQFVDYICANPKAYEAHTRFIETDMNRSYKTGGHSYEEERADTILAQIQDEQYDYVLDVHTTTADVGGVFVSTQPNDINKKLIQASRITDIIVMDPTIAEHSLIGNIASSISIEYNEVLAAQPSSLESLSHFVQNLVNETPDRPIERSLYYVDGFITNEENVDGLINFTLSRQGYYPLLFGEANYTKYRGFKATTKSVELI